jgi:hypothetical protein
VEQLLEAVSQQVPPLQQRLAQVQRTLEQLAALEAAGRLRSRALWAQEHMAPRFDAPAREALRAALLDLPVLPARLEAERAWLLQQVEGLLAMGAMLQGAMQGVGPPWAGEQEPAPAQAQAWEQLHAHAQAGEEQQQESAEGAGAGAGDAAAAPAGDQQDEADAAAALPEGGGGGDGAAAETVARTVGGLPAGCRA